MEEQPQAVQIVSPKNHSFELNFIDLERILFADDIKDRHVVVVSIAGAFRKGKSFLINFFLRYLEAQYMTMNVSDWIKNEAHGFRSQGGQQPVTTGIWMWSEVFTHDFNNGKKVAIILLDTQGIFDNQSSMKDCITIFTISMMLSSIQCYNLMQNVQENDLHHLELFSEYGRLVLGESNEKPFQKLLFIVRDWQYSSESGYGWNGKGVIDKVLTENAGQTFENHQLRKRIKLSFQEITAFLLPHPGLAVAQGENLQQIDSNFINYVKELVPAILSPENLIVKKINGQELRARDWFQYFQTYTRNFNGNTLPEPKTIFMATAEASYLILQNDCLNIYVDCMRRSLDEADTYFSELELRNIHQNSLAKAIAKFTEKPKLGGDELVSQFKGKIESATEEKFVIFKRENDTKQGMFIEKANLHNKNAIKDIRMNWEESISMEVSDTGFDLTRSNLQELLRKYRDAALDQFHAQKLGEAEISDVFRENLNRDLVNDEQMMWEMWYSYEGCVRYYNDEMTKWLEETGGSSTENGLLNIHQKSKNEAAAKFSGSGTNKIAHAFQRRIESDIQMKYLTLQSKNNDKRRNFIGKACQHNEDLCNELRATFENRMRMILGATFLDDSNFINLFFENRNITLQQFDSRKMGGFEISQNFREKLGQEMDNLQISLKQSNDLNRPPQPQPQPQSVVIREQDNSGNVLEGATTGALIGSRFGPVGAAIGAVGGFFVGLFKR